MLRLMVSLPSTSSELQHEPYQPFISYPNLRMDEVRDDGVEIVEREEPVVERASGGSGGE